MDYRPAPIDVSCVELSDALRRDVERESEGIQQGQRLRFGGQTV